VHASLTTPRRYGLAIGYYCSWLVLGVPCADTFGNVLIWGGSYIKMVTEPKCNLKNLIRLCSAAAVNYVNTIMYSYNFNLIMYCHTSFTTPRRYGLAIGYYCSWLVRGLMALTSPISWPLGRLLDWLLGSEHTALYR
jgi:hypothetical protein